MKIANLQFKDNLKLKNRLIIILLIILIYTQIKHKSKLSKIKDKINSKN